MSIHRITVGGCTIELARGDITEQRVDAIVNAANAGLRGGGGVDGAIHSRGGPEIMAECRKIGRCPTGNAVATGAGRLPCRWVIHAVGPIYSAIREDAEQLASAYRESLRRAVELGAQSVAVPSLSTGAYGYPIDEAAPIALRTVAGFVRDNETLKRIVFVLFSDDVFSVYHHLLPGYGNA